MEKAKKIKIFRDRFHGRQELYGRQWQTTREDGTLIKGYAPKCEAFWTSVCHIKLKDGTTCARCTHKKYSPVTDESVWEHISGEEKQIHYLVHDDGTVHLAAFDLDNKPGKEAHGYFWEDVKVLTGVLDAENIPYGIARSTTAGFHIYMFMQNAYSAAKFRAISFWIFEKAGFSEQMRQGVRPLPEFFPKQSYTGGFGPGNGIAPPMIEPRWEQERNCFVDSGNFFIPAEQQWEYLDSIPRVPAAALDAIIEKYDIDVEEDEKLLSGTSPSAAYKRAASRMGGVNGKWQQPLTGSFEKVIEGCAAIRKVFEKAAKGETIGHQEGFGSFHLAMHCCDGMEIFKSRIPGWGSNERDMHQLEHSIDKNYAPWTCKKLQENGVCPAGKKCFEKRPPLALVEGHYVVMTDVPEEQWAEPSPLRYGFGKGEDFLEKLKKEADQLSPGMDENAKGSALRDISRRAMVFDEDQQRELKEYIRSKKVITAPDLKKMFNASEKEHAKELKEKAVNRDDSVRVGDNVYQIRGHCYAMLKSIKGELTTAELSNFIFNIEEERSYLDDNRVIRSVYLGKFLSAGFEREFEIETKKWADNNSFIEFFSTLAAHNFNFLRQDLEYIKQAALAFSKKFGIKKTNKLVTQGWYQKAYLMPGIQVDADGVRPNTEKEVDLSGNSHAAFLGFKMKTEDELKELLFHIKNDFLNAWPRMWTMVGLAHAMFPPIAEPLGLKKKPVLFFEGLTGTGKTEICQTLQYFWGEFDVLVNLSSTAKSIMSISHSFKDALLVLDDYKGIDAQQISALQRVIQYSYNMTGRYALTNSSQLQQPKYPRATLLFTGETFITNDASVVARTIIIEVNKPDTKLTKEKYQYCLERRKDYSGVTPYFIHWFLQQDKDRVMDDMYFAQSALALKADGMQNKDRVAENLAWNHTVWKLFVRFLVENSVCSDQERKELIDEHLSYMHILLHNTLSRCSDDQSGVAFVRILNGLISSNTVTIDGLNLNEDTKNKPLMGFISTEDDTGRKVMNVFASKAHKEIAGCGAHRPYNINGTEQDLGRQFAELGYIRKDPGRNKVQRSYNGVIGSFWSFYMDAIGVSDGTLTVIKGGAPITKCELPEFHKAIPSPERPFG